MVWLNVQKYNWEEPLRFATYFQNHNITLLFSGRAEEKTGTLSYLFIDPVDVVEGNNFNAIPNSELQDEFIAPDWVGYLGYELNIDKVTAAPAPFSLPVLRLVRYQHVLKFDHHARSVEHYSRDGSALKLDRSRAQMPLTIHVNRIASNFTKARYEQSVRETVSRIHAGDFYQANITRKFFGNFADVPDSLSLFEKLCEVSPAPYSAYIRHGDSAILSSSPECFLRIDNDGTITSRPIKGSARRERDDGDDKKIQQSLRESCKNQAENLMIVDLMRNDLSKVATPESVVVTEQSGLYSYATIHHLISTIQAKKREAASIVDVIEACFPPGSMTGAPKKAAIEWCRLQEQMARGIYSGAIGWIGKNSCDLSVVIRTLIIQGDQFEFQVGGGIVADSDPIEEWQETLTKARGILTALGLNEHDLAAL